MDEAFKKKTGLIVRAVGGFFYVDAGDESLVECRGRGVLKRKKEKPLVGDSVEIEVLEENTGVVVKVLPRKNAFIRPPVANVELFAVVASMENPRIRPKILDKFLVMAEANRAEAIMCISKEDLVSKAEIEKISDIYKKIYRIVVFSKYDDGWKKELVSMIEGKAVAFTGPSGVGKTTIINGILPELSLETGRVSRKTGRGRHTTRHTEIFEGPGGTKIFDTPGFTSFEVLNIEPERLGSCYPEIRKRESDCKFKNCKHMREPGCAIKKAVQRGEMSLERYTSYVENMEKLLKEGKRNLV